MIKKNVDSILIGQNYISFLIAFDLLKKHKEVLILDDSRMRDSKNYYTYFSSLEKSFIQSWAQDCNVDLLSDLDGYLKLAPFHINLDATKVYLGRDNPYLNLMELARKLPDIFKDVFIKIKQNNISMQEFNSDYFNFCARTGKTLCLFKSLQNLNLLTFSHHAPDYMNEIFSIFEEKIKSFSQKDNENILVYALRSIYQNVLEQSVSNIESLHLLICLLGPRFHFDSTVVYKKLVDQLVERGGFFRSKKIREWKFFKNKPWCVELDSFEGIVHPKNIAFIGGRPVQFPLSFESNEHYLSYEATIKPKKNFNQDRFSFYFSTTNIGSNIPFAIKREEGENVVVELLTRLVSCQKAQFHKSDIISALKFHHLIDDESDVLNIKEGTDILSLRAGDSINFPHKVAILDTAQYFKALELRDVHYIGPLQKAPLGLLSSLMESKDHRNFMS